MSVSRTVERPSSRRATPPIWADLIYDGDKRRQIIFFWQIVAKTVEPNIRY
jgi:hypothetical protein